MWSRLSEKRDLAQGTDAQKNSPTTVEALAERRSGEPRCLFFRRRTPHRASTPPAGVNQELGFTLNTVR
jgi:hypothetical protein